MSILCKCPDCKSHDPKSRGRFFLSEKKVMRHLRDTQRERSRQLNGATIVRQIGQAQLHTKTLMPMHESNSKEQRIKPDLVHKKRWGIRE